MKTKVIQNDLKRRLEKMKKTRRKIFSIQWGILGAAAASNARLSIMVMKVNQRFYIFFF
jgi:hypothetical protein